MDSLNLCLSLNTSVSPSVLKDKLVGFRILGHSCLLSELGTFLSIFSQPYGCWWELWGNADISAVVWELTLFHAAFRIISILCIFHILIIIRHGEFLIWSHLFGVLCASCIWMPDFFHKLMGFFCYNLTSLSIPFNFYLYSFHTLNCQVWPHECIPDFLKILLVLLFPPHISLSILAS